MSDYSTEEKINYIFKELKNQKTRRIAKTIFRLIIIGFGIYISLNFIQGIDKEKLISHFSATIGEIVQPITENIVNNMIEEKSVYINNISPEMLEQIKTLNK